MVAIQSKNASKRPLFSRRKGRAQARRHHRALATIVVTVVFAVTTLYTHEPRNLNHVMLRRGIDLYGLEAELVEFEQAIRSNKIFDGITWARPEWLVDPASEGGAATSDFRNGKGCLDSYKFMYARGSRTEGMAWAEEARSIEGAKMGGPSIDFEKHLFSYPETPHSSDVLASNYPHLESLGKIMERWPQDEIDFPPTPFLETLIHFNYSNNADMKLAEKFRSAKIPFKITNIPDLDTVREKWTDTYIATNMDDKHNTTIPTPNYFFCQESRNNFFPFYKESKEARWCIETMGMPPTKKNSMTFKQWCAHAHYADSVGILPEQPHFYYQIVVDQFERLRPDDEKSFISKDLPLFAPMDANFFVFDLAAYNGIQCRFGERGVTAAIHYDIDRNMVAVLQGAKRYILLPPKECRKLGIITDRSHPMFRHSMLNFGHMNYANDTTNNGMSDLERYWLEMSKHAFAVETVLKAGEVLYIPANWFHYITSLQKSIQCNVRSGMDPEGSEKFGGWQDVTNKCGGSWREK